MTGREALDQALQLLGYEAPYGAADGRGLLFVNKIAEELWGYTHPEEAYAPVEDADTPLPELAAGQALPFGVAMLAAQAAGDGANQALYAQLYDRRRAAALPGVRQDVLPRA